MREKKFPSHHPDEAALVVIICSRPPIAAGLINKRVDVLPAGPIAQVQAEASPQFLDRLLRPGCEASKILVPLRKHLYQQNYFVAVSPQFEEGTMTKLAEFVKRVTSRTVQKI